MYILFYTNAYIMYKSSYFNNIFLFRVDTTRGMEERDRGESREQRANVIR